MEEEDNMYLFDSDDGFDEEGKTLLDNFNSKPKNNINAKNTVLDFDEDDDEIEDDDDKSDIDMGSDLEEQQDYMPDDRAWGQRRKNYYNADFVDKDYFGAYNAEEAEAAEMEEQEARNIQKRLLEQINDADFFTDFKTPVEDAKVTDQSEAIAPDMTKLSKSEKLRFLQKNIPEFSNLVEDYEAKSAEATERILPILTLIKEDKLPKSLAGDFLRIKYRLILNYLVNISYYILLKLKMTPAKNHPVMKALLRYRQLLTQLQQVDDEIIAPQVEKILASLAEPIEEMESVKIKIKKQKKSILKMLKKIAPKSESEEEEQFSENINVDQSSDDDDGTEEAEANSEPLTSDKRKITYQMAKNKGLTPKRSKEQRNPRVKHRNKFRKATIRRRGQVRTPRTEIPVYGGEPTGIKIGLKKGRKLM